MIYDTFRQALQNVWSNKFRTFLTMLGIIIGEMAVIVIVGLGNGMTTAMKDSFSSIGTNLITITIMGHGQRTAAVEDVVAIAENNPEYFSAISPMVSITGSVKVGSDTYSRTSVNGVSEDYLSIDNYTVAEGRGLLYVDLMENKKVCVIGDYLNRVAYGGNAVGQTIKIGADRFTIVGVLKAKVTDPSSQEGSEDDYVYVPYTTALRLSKQNTASSYIAVLADESKATQAKKVFEQGLYKIFNSDNGYFITSMSELLETMTQTINMVITVLTTIAGISLLVGGIGIMNIMMVSVTERTREIGIRKALGAKERVILLMFVVEAATTSALGGTLGIGIGYLISTVLNVFLPMAIPDMNLSVQPSLSSILVAFSISVGIGILFGYLPAKRAARLNPIEALRYD
ncbi:ABC transporter permease [Faecalibacterium gallinarum]|uniref:Permease n=1 Tax=Faecalibacterium gallinarum TaxID=2903556 RepID=A0AA37J090_9FIRM|nr:ABC transporter permease [Faecalibacterium gallinarum]GJN65572.1 permease [Faecalibacterium gallinarum]